MNALAKRLTKLESRAGPTRFRYIFMPDDLTNAEEAAWHELHTSPAALGAAGISPNVSVVVVRWYGTEKPFPRGCARPANPGGPREQSNLCPCDAA